MVRILLGTKWLEAIPLLQILAVFGTIRAMQAGVGSVYLALGMTRSIAIVAIPHVIVGLPLATYLLVHYGLKTATIAVVVSGAVALVTSLAILMYALPVRLAELASCYWRPLLSIAVMVPAELVLLGSTAPAPATFQYLVWTLFLIIVGAMVYSASVWALWRLAGRPLGAESIVLERLRALRKRKPSSTLR